MSTTSSRHAIAHRRHWRLVGPAAAAAVVLLSAVACADRADSARATSSTAARDESTTTELSVPRPPTTLPAAGAEPDVPAPPASTSTLPAAPRPLLVVIDPGHNGRNGAHSSEIGRQVDAGGFMKDCNTTGTASSAMSEAEFNWLVAQQLTSMLDAAGIRSVSTRDGNDGWGPCIDDRGLTAARSGADLLVSLHADGAGPSSSGFHIIHPAAGPTVSADTAIRSAELAAALRDQLVAAGLTPSNYVGIDGLVERGDLGTLNRAGVPAVMIESGNMRHPGDAALQASEAGRHRIASAIAATLTEWQR